MRLPDGLSGVTDPKLERADPAAIRPLMHRQQVDSAELFAVVTEVNRIPPKRKQPDP